MIHILIDAGVVILSYLFGSIPFGLLVVRLISGKDIRQVASGRTGGTNAMRAAGTWAGILTAVFDTLKGASAIWVARTVTDNVWVYILAPLAAILGHNYSIFLAERDEKGRLRLRGGAGGAPTVGGAFGLWPASLLIIFPLGLFIYFGIGYASITTMSIAFIAILIFTVRFWMGISPWQYILYGIIAELLLVLALRPNIMALIEGKERFHGWRPWRKRDQTHAVQGSGGNKVS